MVKTRFVVIAIVALTAVGVAQQAPDPLTPAGIFEVASVKPNKSGGVSGGIQWLPGGRLSAVNVPLRSLIHYAYQVRPFQIEGVPEWAATESYDINAKAAVEVPPIPNGLSPVQMQLLRRLLADRFKLATHTEMRERPIYALMLARPDGKVGPQLTASPTDCTALLKAPAGRRGLPILAPGDRMQCGLMIGPQRINAGGIGLDELAHALIGLVERTVVDRTGLTGRYDVQLTFQGETLIGPGGALISPPRDAAAQNLPSLFTAMQEQLGLKLEPTRGPVEVLVVERVDRPTAD